MVGLRFRIPGFTARRDFAGDGFDVFTGADGGAWGTMAAGAGGGATVGRRGRRGRVSSSSALLISSRGRASSGFLSFGFFGICWFGRSARRHVSMMVDHESKIKRATPGSPGDAGHCGQGVHGPGLPQGAQLRPIPHEQGPCEGEAVQ